MSRSTDALTALYWLIRKDVVRFLSDRNGLFASVAMPVILGAFLGTLFAPDDEPNPVSVAFVHEAPDNGSRRFEAELRKSKAVALVDVITADAARDLLRRGKQPVAVLARGGGTSAEVRILTDPSRTAEADIVRGMVEAAVYKSLATGFTDPASRAENTAGLALLLGAGGVGEPGKTADVVAGLVGQLTGSDGGLGAVTAVETLERDGRPAYNTYAHNFSGMLCMFLLFFGIEQAKARLDERALGLDRRVAMAPVGRVLPRLASGLATMLLALAISAAVFAVAIGGFGVEIRGSIPGFVLVVLGQAAFAGGFSMALSGWIASPRAVQGAGSAFALIASFLGGAWMPSFMLPSWCQGVAIFLPTRWATEGFAATTWRGLGLEAALLPAGILLALGLALGALGIAGARRAGA